MKKFVVAAFALGCTTLFAAEPKDPIQPPIQLLAKCKGGKCKGRLVETMLAKQTNGVKVRRPAGHVNPAHIC